MAQIIRLGLQPGIQYAAQVRAVAANGEASEWSPRFLFMTDLSAILPETPTGITWVAVGDAFHGEWGAITTKTDATPANVVRYEIELVAAAITKVVSIPQKTDGPVVYDLSFEANAALFSGTPRATIDIRVRAVDNSGNKSAWSSTVSASNPSPGPPTSLTSSVGNSTVTLGWTPPSDTDLIGYNIYASTSGSGFTPGAGNKVGFVNATTYTFTTATYSPWFFKIRAVDKFNQESTDLGNGTGLTPTTPFGSDTTPPTNPTNLVATPGFDSTRQRSYADLTWTASVSTDVQYYIIRYAPTAASNWQYLLVPGDQTAVRVDNLNPSTQYYFGIYAVDWAGNESTSVLNATVYPITTTADTSAPSTPTAPTASANTLQIQVTIPGTKASDGTPMEADVAYYNVYAGTSSGFTANAASMLGQITAGPAMVGTFDIPANAGSGSTQGWFVKIIAVDRTGNVSSASAASSQSNVNLISTANISDLAVTTAKINSLEANKITAGTGIIADLTIKSTLTLGDAATNGIFRSYDYQYTGGKTGFYMDSDELVIKSGSISAAALQISDTVNLVDFPFSDLELTPGYYTGKVQLSNMTFSIDNVDKKFNNQSLKLNGTSTFNFITLDAVTASTTGNFTVVPGGHYLLSFWGMVKASSVTTPVVPIINFTTGVGTTEGTSGLGATNLPNDGVWRRHMMSFTAPNNATGPAVITFLTALVSTFYIDGIQVELGTQLQSNFGFETTASPWAASANCTVARSNAQAYSGTWSLAATSTNTSNMTFVSTAAPQTDGVSVTPGRYYQIGGRIRTAVTARNVNFTTQFYDAAGVFISQTIGPNVQDSTTWKQVNSHIMQAPTGAAFMRISVTVASTATSEVHYVDDMYVYDVTPSQWRPPGGTAISGSQIRTGSIRSNDLAIDYLGADIPGVYAWAIDAEGDAQFGNALVRGSLVVGQGDAFISRVQSFNYSPGVTGWIIRSDGFSEFRQMVADSINGEAIQAGTLTVDKIQPEDTLTQTIKVTGKISLEGPMGEEVGLGFWSNEGGFRVYGPDQINVTNKAFVAATGIATLTTASDHGFAINQPLLVENVGAPFDGVWTIATVPTATTFTYDAGIGGSDVTSVAATGSAKSKSSINTIQGSKLIDFPVDGTSPNIVSGILTAESLVVTTGASFRGLSDIDRGASLFLNSAVVAPKSAPVVSTTYKTTNLPAGMYTGRVITGLVKGHNSNWFISSYTVGFRDTGSNYVDEISSIDGSFIANRLTQARLDVITGITTEYQGISYSSTHSRYYVLKKIVASSRVDAIYTFNTSWTQQGGDHDVINVSISNSNASTLGYDHVNNKPLYGWYPSSSVTLYPITVDGTGQPTATDASVNPSGAGISNLSNLAFVARVSGHDGARGSDRYIIKDAYNTGTAWTSNFLPYNPSALSTPISSEQWHSGGFNVWAACYHVASDRFYAINSSNIAEYQSGDSMWGYTQTLTFVSRTGNVATATTSATHDLVPGAPVTVANVTPAGFNGNYTVVAVPSSTTFTYANTGSNLGSTAAGASATAVFTNSTEEATFPRWLGYSWYDADSTGGTHETNMGPTVKKDLRKRSAMSVTISPIPKGAGGTDDPTQARIYVANSLTVPEQTTPSVTWKWRDSIIWPATNKFLEPTFNPSGAQPKSSSTNEFLALGATPAQISSSAGNTYIKGTGESKFNDVLYIGSSIDVNAAWVTFTPTISNWTLSNGTLVGKYTRIGKTVKFLISYTVGSSDTKSGNLVFALPANVSSSTGQDHPIGISTYFDTSASSYNQGWFRRGGSIANGNPTLAGNLAVNPTVPWTWATGDKIMIQGEYESA